MCGRPEDPTVKNLCAAGPKIPRWRTCVQQALRSHGEEPVCDKSQTLGRLCPEARVADALFRSANTGSVTGSRFKRFMQGRKYLTRCVYGDLWCHVSDKYTMVVLIETCSLTFQSSSTRWSC